MTRLILASLVLAISILPLCAQSTVLWDRNQSVYSWTALPLQASVGSKLRSAARGADAAADERLRAVWISMALIWSSLAAHKERMAVNSISCRSARAGRRS
jgi:hypothetical protein